MGGFESLHESKKIKTRKVVIVGSARKDGNTTKMVEIIKNMSQWEVIDLNDYVISHYDYENNNKDDDYLRLMKRIIDNYDTIIFATPVYWYSMSGRMKVFFDRMTDLLTIEKDLGRKLRGKQMAAISCSGGNDNGDNFFLPFSETAKYLGMKYVGHVHTYPNQNEEVKIGSFVQSIEG